MTNHSYPVPFTKEHEKDLYQYYVSLSTFFQVTGVEKRDRSGSARAQKARAKLLRLSSSQFYELSTDVSDELKRRISEEENQGSAEGEGGFLSPKENFHVKRNQARQKLANLSQTRFNDLVDDILFEIKRRGFDKKVVTDKVDNAKEDTLYEEYDKPVIPKLTKPERKEESEEATKVPELEESSTKNEQEDSQSTVPPATTSIQTSLIIPKKASIDWTSSEEEDEDEEEVEEKTAPTINDDRNIEAREVAESSTEIIPSYHNESGIIDPEETINHNSSEGISPGNNSIKNSNLQLPTTANDDTDNHGISPVSYTHLDVYKRQAIYRYKYSQ